MDILIKRIQGTIGAQMRAVKFFLDLGKIS